MTTAKTTSTAGKKAVKKPNENWVAYISPFVAAVSMKQKDVDKAFKGLIGDPSEAAISALKNKEHTPFADIASVLPNVPKGILRQAVSDHLREQGSGSGDTPGVMPMNMSVLPDVPSDDSWLQALKTGGELKVDEAAIISAVRAGLASRTGLFTIPNKLVELMEAHAEELAEPLGNEFFQLRKQVTRRSYSEVFAALDVEGSYVTETRKKQLMSRLEKHLWPAVESYHRQLKSWQNTWTEGMSNPGMLFTAIAASQTGAPLPPGMMTMPETDTLRDAADSFNDTLNKIFAGTGIVISRAMAYDAQSIKKVLENQSLPAQVGVQNREQLLKKLGANVSADYVRLETNVTKYILGIIHLPKVAAGNDETSYLGALLMLGNQIPWDRLNSNAANRYPN